MPSIVVAGVVVRSAQRAETATKTSTQVMRVLINAPRNVCSFVLPKIRRSNRPWPLGQVLPFIGSGTSRLHSGQIHTIDHLRSLEIHFARLRNHCFLEDRHIEATL